MRRRSARGFTLIEMLAAISHLRPRHLRRRRAARSTHRRHDAHRSGGRRASREKGTALVCLARLLMDTRRNTDSTKRFRGDENSLELWTLCDVPGGWAEDCRGDAVDRPTGRQQRRHRRTCREAPPSRFGGKKEQRASDTTMRPPTMTRCGSRQWSSNASLPVAIGLVAGADTIVFPVGPPVTDHRPRRGFTMITVLWVMTVGAIVAMAGATRGPKRGERGDESCASRARALDRPGLRGARAVGDRHGACRRKDVRGCRGHVARVASR